MRRKYLIERVLLLESSLVSIRSHVDVIEGVNADADGEW